MKLAIFTSLSPIRSGISDYSEALLPRLARHFDVEVFVDDYAPAGFSADARIRIRNWREYNPERFDATLYHIGNNPYHIYMYNVVLQHPGIVVLHEFNLHHLIADATIKRGDWEGYLREAEYNGGAEALRYAKRVEALEMAPDYEGLPMNRRVLENSAAVVVHSRYLVDQIREAGYRMPVQQIPHGVRIPEVNRNAWREKLGIDPATPLIGTFGFMRPHKRIGEVLLAMQRLTRVENRARMIVVGEEHPNFPIRELISHLGLESVVQVLGYVPLEELEGWISAVDICVNLRYPSVGETSGTMARALGLGRALIVSDVGSFSELSDEICLKVPVSEGEKGLPIGHRPLRFEEINSYAPPRPEVDRLTEHFLSLVTRPEAARVMGARARQHVAREWNWDRVAELYAEFIRETVAVPAVQLGKHSAEAPALAAAVSGSNGAPQSRHRGEYDLPVAEPALVSMEAGSAVSRNVDGVTAGPRGSQGSAKNAPAAAGRPEIVVGAANNGAGAQASAKKQPMPDLGEYIQGFCQGNTDALEYVKKHVTRLVRTLEITPPGSALGRVLEMGAYLQITPALSHRLGYGEVRGAYLGPLGKTDHRRVTSETGEIFECEIDLFDAEKDPYPYSEGHFTTVLCCEVIEHLARDPMHMMSELNRVMKPGGHLVLSTPNICSWRAVEAVLLGYHPGFFHHYIKPSSDGQVDPRHSREYSPKDIQLLLEAAGFSVERLETGAYGEERASQYPWVRRLLDQYQLPAHLRGEVIYAVGRKMGGVSERYPSFLYAGG